MSRRQSLDRPGILSPPGPFLTPSPSSSISASPRLQPSPSISPFPQDVLLVTNNTITNTTQEQERKAATPSRRPSIHQLSGSPNAGTVVFQPSPSQSPAAAATVVGITGNEFNTTLVGSNNISLNKKTNKRSSQSFGGYGHGQGITSATLAATNMACSPKGTSKKATVLPTSMMNTGNSPLTYDSPISSPNSGIKPPTPQPMLQQYPVVNAGNQLLQFIPGPQLIATTANQQRSQMMAAVQNHQHQHHQHQNSQIGTSGTKITRGPQQILPKPQQPMMHSTSEKTVITQTKAVTVQQSGQLSQSPHQPTVVTTTTTQAQGGQIILPGGNLNTQPLLLNQMPLIVQQQNTPQGVQLILRPPTPQLTAPSLVIHNTRPQLQQNQPQQLLRILNTNGAMQLATAPTFIVSSQANLIQQNLQTIKANTQTTPITQLSSLQAAAPRTQQFAINSHIIGQSMAHLQNLQLNGNLAQIQMPNGLNGQIISQLPAQFQQSLAGFNQINQNINLNQLNSTNIQLAAAAAANAAFQSPPPPQVNELQMPTVMSTQNIQFSTNNHNVTQQINMTSPAVTPQPQLIQSVTPEPVRNPTPVLQNVMTSHQATTTVLVQPDNIMQMGTTSSVPQQSHSVQRTNFKQHHDSELPITKPAPKKAKSRKKKVQPTPPPPPIVSTASGSISPPLSSSSYMNTTSSNKQSNVTSTGKLDLANVMKLCGIMEDDDYMDTEIDTPIQQSQPIQQIEESKAIVHPHHQQQQQQQQHNISSSPAPPNNSSDIMITIPNNGDIPFTFTIPTSQSCDTKMTQLGSNLQQACSNQTLQTLINSCIDTKSSNNTNSNLDAQNIVIKFDQNDSGQPYTISIPRMQHDETQQQQQQTMNNVQIMQKNQQHNIQSILQSHQYQNQVQQHCNTSMAVVQTSLPSQQHIITSRPMGTSTTTSSFNLIAASSSSSSSNNVCVPTFVNSIIGTATNIIGNQTSGGTTQTIQSQINEIQNQLMGVATPMSTSTTSIPAHTIINSGPIISSNSTQHQIPTSLNQHHHHSNIPIVSSTSTINTSGSQLFTSTTTLPTTTTTTTTTATVKPRRKPANKRNGKKIDTIPTPVGNVPSQIGNIQISQIDSTKIQNQTIPISNVVENKIQIMPIVDNKFGQNQQHQQQQNVNNQIMFQSNIQQQISQQQQQNQASNNLTNLQIDQSNLMINRNQNDNSSNNCNSNNSNNNNIINQNQSISNQQQRNLIIGNSNQQQQQSIQQQQQQGGNNNNNNISTPITPQPSTSPAAAATTTAIFPQLTGSLSLAFADDGGRLLLRHDPNSPQDSQSQLILQAILNGALCNVTIINEPYDKNKAIKNNMAIMSTTTNNNNNNQNNQNNINNNNNNNSNSTMPNNNNQSMPITNNMNVTSKSTIIQSNKNQNNTIQIPATIQQTTTIGNSQININQSTTQQSADNNSSSNNNYSTISSTQKRLLEMRKNEVHNIQQQQQQQHHQQLLNPTNMINANSPKLVSLPKVDANRQLFSLNTLTNQITQINPMQTTAALGPMERLLIAPIGINAQQLAECWSQGQIHLNNIGQVSQANEQQQQQQQQQSTNNTTPRIQQQIVHPQQHTINSGNINNSSSSSSSNIQPLQQMQQTKQVANVAPIIDASKAKCETTKLPTVKKVTKPRKPKVCHDNSNLNKNLKIQQNSQKVDLNVKTTMNPIQIVQPTTAVSVNKEHNILNRTIGTSSSSSSTSSSSSSSISTTTTSTTANIHPFQTQSGTKLIGVTAPMQQITQQRNQCNNTNNINNNNNNSNTNLINSNNITMPPVVSQPGPSITSNQTTITLPMSSQSISNNNNNSNNNINNTNISNINSNNNIVNHQLKSQSQQQSQISAPLLNVNTQQTTQPVVPRVQTIQLTPQQQQLLKTVQIQIQQLSAKLQNKSLLETLNIPPDFDPSNPMYNKPLPSLNNIQNMNDSEIHAALQRLFIEQKKILASGKVIPTIAAGTAHAFITSTSMASSNQTVGQSINSSSVSSGANNVTTTQIGTHSGGGTNMTTQEVPSIQNNNSQIVFPQSHQTTKVLTSASSSSLTSSLASTSSVNSMITTTSLSKNDGQPIPANIVQPNNHNTTTNSTTQRIHIYPMQHQIQSQHKTQIIQQQQQQQQHLTSSQISLQQHHNQQQNKIQQQAHIVQQQQQIHQQRLQQQQASPKLLASKQPPSALTVIPITESISTVSSQLASSVPPSSSTTTTTTTATAVSIKVENVIKVEPLDQQLASLSTTSSQSMIASPKSKMPRQMLFERFERQIEVDQEGCTKPDYVEPFHSKHDAVKRLIRYHCMYQNDEEVPSDEEDEFEKIAINLQEQFKTISNKFQYLLLEESMRSHRTSELRMIEELIVTDMRKELHEMRNEMNLANTNTGIYQNNNITSSTKTINNLNYNNSAACKVIKKESDIVQQQQPPDQKQLYLQQQKEYNQIQQHNNNLIQQHHHHHHHQQQQQHHNNSQYLIHQQQQYQNNNNNINHQLQQLNQRILNKTTVDTNNSLVKNEIKSEPCDLMFDKCDNINLNTNSNVNNKLNNIMNNHNSNNNRTTPLVRTTNNNSNDTSNPVVSFTHNKLFNNNNEFNSIMIKDEKDNNNVLCNSNLDILPGSVQSISSSSSSSSSSSLNNFTSNSKNYSHKDDPIKEELDNFDIECEIRPSFIMKKIDTTNNNNLIGITSSSSSSSSISSSSSNIGGCGGTTSGTNGQIMSTANLSPITPPSISARTPNVDDVTSNDFPIDYFVNTTHHNNRSSSSSSFSSALPSFTEHLIDGSGGGGQTIVKKKTNNNDCDDANDGLDNDVLTHKTNHETYDEWLCLQKELSFIASEKKSDNLSGITINHHHHHQQQQQLHNNNVSNKYVDKQFTEIFDTSSSSKCVVDNQLSDIFGTSATTTTTTVGPSVDNDNRKTPQEQQQQHHQQQIVTNNLHLSELFSSESITNKSVETRLEAMFGESPVEKTNRDLVETRLEELFSDSPTNSTNNNNNNNSNINVVNSSSQHYSLIGNNDDNENVDAGTVVGGGGGGASGVSGKRQWNNSDLLSPNASSSPITTYGKRSCMVNAFIEDAHVTSNHPRWMTDQSFDFTTSSTTATATNGPNDIITNSDIIRKRSWNGDCISNTIEHVTTNKKICYNNHNKHTSDLDEDLLGLDPTTSPEVIANEILHHAIQQQQQQHQHHTNLVQSSNSASGTTINLGHLQHDVHTGNLVQQMQANVLMQMQSGNTHHHNHHHHQLQQQQQQHHHNHQLHIQQQQNHHHHHQMQTNNSLLGPPNVGGNVFDTNNLGSSLNHNPNLSGGSSGSMSSNFDEDINRHVQNAIDSILNLQNSESDSLNFSLDHSMGSFLADSPLDNQNNNGQQQQQQQQHNSVNIIDGGAIVQTSSTSSHHGIISLIGKRRSHNNNHRIDDLGDCLISGIGSNCVNNIVGSGGSSSSSGVGIGDNSNLMIDSPSSVISATTNNGGGGVGGNGLTGGIGDCCGVSGIDDAIKSIMTS